MPQYIRRFWVMLDGSTVELPEGETHLTFAIARPGAFGLSQDDMLFYNERPDDGNRQEAMLDRILSVGCGGIAGSNSQEASQDTPIIMLEITDENAVDSNGQFIDDPRRRDKTGMLTIVFWRESYPMNDRMVEFLRQKKDGTEGIHKNMNVLMKEWGTQRKWTQTVGSFLSGYQFAADPSKGVTCVRCGQPISRDELIGTTKCPRCDLVLA